MLEICPGNTGMNTVYDLGCGRCSIVITAAKVFGARGVGVVIDPSRIRESRRSRKAGVTDRVDLFSKTFSRLI